MGGVYRRQGYAVLTTDSRSGAGVAKFSAAVRAMLADKIAQWNAKGQTGKPVRVMVVGIPNVGKSTFINRVLGRKSARAADKPGVTRGSQWFRVEGALSCWIRRASCGQSWTMSAPVFTWPSPVQSKTIFSTSKHWRVS